MKVNFIGCIIAFGALAVVGSAHAKSVLLHNTTNKTFFVATFLWDKSYGYAAPSFQLTSDVVQIDPEQEVEFPVPPTKIDDVRSRYLIFEENKAVIVSLAAAALALHEEKQTIFAQARIWNFSLAQKNVAEKRRLVDQNKELLRELEGATFRIGDTLSEKRPLYLVEIDGVIKVDTKFVQKAREVKKQIKQVFTPQQEQPVEVEVEVVDEQPQVEPSWQEQMKQLGASAAKGVKTVGQKIEQLGGRAEQALMPVEEIVVQSEPAKSISTAKGEQKKGPGLGEKIWGRVKGVAQKFGKKMEKVKQEFITKYPPFPKKDFEDPALIINGFGKIKYVRVCDTPSMGVDACQPIVKLDSAGSTFFETKQKSWFDAKKELLVSYSPLRINDENVGQFQQEMGKNEYFYSLRKNDILNIGEESYSFYMSKRQIGIKVQKKALKDKELFVGIYFVLEQEDGEYILASPVTSINTHFTENDQVLVTHIDDPREAGLWSFFGFGRKKMLVIGRKKDIFNARFKQKDIDALPLGSTKLMDKKERLYFVEESDNRINLYTQKEWESKGVIKEIKEGWLEKLLRWGYHKYGTRVQKAARRVAVEELTREK